MVLTKCTRDRIPLPALFLHRPTGLRNPHHHHPRLPHATRAEQQPTPAHLLQVPQEDLLPRSILSRVPAAVPAAVPQVGPLAAAAATAAAAAAAAAADFSDFDAAAGRSSESGGGGGRRRGGGFGLCVLDHVP